MTYIIDLFCYSFLSLQPPSTAEAQICIIIQKQ